MMTSIVVFNLYLKSQSKAIGSLSHVRKGDYKVMNKCKKFETSEYIACGY